MSAQVPWILRQAEKKIMSSMYILYYFSIFLGFPYFEYKIFFWEGGFDKGGKILRKKYRVSEAFRLQE